MVIEWISRNVEPGIVRETYGQITLANRYDSAGIAMHHGNRATPVALTRNEPVAQAVVDRARARPGGFEAQCHVPFGTLHIETVQKARIGKPAGADIGVLADLEAP